MTTSYEDYFQSTLREVRFSYYGQPVWHRSELVTDDFNTTLKRYGDRIYGVNFGKAGGYIAYVIEEQLTDGK